MNVYDFDDTIYNGDTNKDIIKFGLRKHPKLVIKALLRARKLKKEYKKNKIKFERVKEEMLSFIFEIYNYPDFIDEFVEKHMKKIKKWYLANKNENDLILSASYELWILKFARKLGVENVIATRVDSHGKIIGNNCKGEEKVRRLKDAFPNAEVVSAYGDSSQDKYVLDLAKKAYVVEGNKLKEYYKDYKFKNSK